MYSARIKMKDKKHYKDIKLTNLPDREVEIIGAITAEKMAVMREKALKKFKEDLELPGFRKGNAPDSLVAQKVGEMRLLEEAAEIALQEEYPNIIDEHKIDAIGRPEIIITKLAPGNDLEFKVKTSLYPDVKLADYKKTARIALSKRSEDARTDKTSAMTVSDSEIDEVIKDIQRNIAHQKLHMKNDGPDHTHNHAPIKDEDLPPVDDNFIKMLGDFKDVADFRSKIKENISAEKAVKEKDKRRVEILETIMKDSTIDLPKIIVDGEMEKMLAQFKDDISKNGLTYDNYLKHIKKTENDLKLEWKDTALKRAKSQVILNTIAKEENIVPKEEDVKKEMENILTHYKDVDRFRARMYVETFMTNELVFQFLESQK